MNKYLLSLIVVLFSAISASAYDFEHGNICYNKISDNEVEVTYYYIDFKNQKQDYYTGDVVIPESIRVNGTKEYTVTKIGKYAFLYSYGLSSVTIPATVKVIGSQAFGDCENLITITISDSDEELTTDYFATGYVPIFTGSPVKSIYVGRPCSAVFRNLPNLEIIEFGENLTDIPCVSDAPKLTSVTIPDKAVSLGGFPNTGLSEITLPNSIKEIGPGAFNNTAISKLELPSALEVIGETAFKDCPLAEITVPASCTHFSGTFKFSNLKTINILAPIAKISAEDFFYCTLLKSLSIPNTYTVIEHSAFEGCCSLESFIVPNSVENIEFEAFLGCSALKSITFGENVYTIGSQAFKECESLESVTCLGYHAPIIIKNVFDDMTYKTATLYYNETSIWYTCDNSVWNNFIKTVPIDPTSAGFGSVVDDSPALIVSYTNSCGMVDSKPFKGLNIVKYSNGQSRKIFIK